ncbi:DUF1990 family protein [Leucobacter zeae]|nr:DUF1990 family protein [Leucobacter zeae]
MSGARDAGGRRSSHVEMPVAYAAVGASKAADLLRFPPEGTTPYEERLRIGSGQDRFLLASSLLMTWGAQRGAGIEVVDVVRGSGSHYEGPSFDDDGRPQAAGAPEEHFGPDGEPYILAGTTATIRVDGQDPRAILVVYTIDEERRVGFAWGTGDELGAVGEQLFTVEHRDDDTVWAVARGFLAAPKSGLFGLKARADIAAALDTAKRQVQALAPGVIPVPAGAAAMIDDAPGAADRDHRSSADDVGDAVTGVIHLEDSEAGGSAERSS